MPGDILKVGKSSHPKINIIKRKIRKFVEKTDYLKRYDKFGINPKALGWHSKKAAEQRYEQIVADINFEGETILDVGCGFAYIIPFIQKKAENFE